MAKENGLGLGHNCQVLVEYQLELFFLQLGLLRVLLGVIGGLCILVFLQETQQLKILEQFHSNMESE